MISVLMVDDEPSVLNLSKLLLEEDDDLQVDTCTTAREALARLAESPYDAIVSDYEMPGMDGISLLSAVREAEMTIPFIVFTGRGREEVVIEALNRGADFYLQKNGTPATVFAELRHVLHQVVARRRSEESLWESERKLSTLMSNLPGMAYRCTNDTKYTMEFVSEGCTNLTGYRPDEILQNREVSYGDLIIPDDREYVWNSIQHALQENGPFTIVYRIRTKDGTLRWVWEKGRGVTGPLGELAALEGFITDITEQKATDDALAESSKKVRMFFDNATDMILINALDDREGLTPFTEANQMVTRKLGYSQDEILRMTPFEIIDPGSREAMQAVADEFRRRDLGTYEFVFRTRDGIRIPVEVSCRILKIRDRNLIFWIARDITERKQAENALQESESRFRKIFEEGPLGMAIAGPDFRYLTVNTTFAGMLGMAPDQVVRLGMPDWIAPEHYGREIALLKRLQRGESEQYHTESRFLRKDGGPFWASVTVSALRDADGRVIYYLTMAEDITERKQAEQAVRESAERFRSIVESAPSVLVIADETGRYTYVSPNCETIIGYSPEELLGTTLLWVHPDDLPRVQEIFEQSGRTGRGVKQFEYKALRKNGEVWYASSSWEMIRDPKNNIRGVLIQTIDITERHIAHRALAASEERFRRMAENLHDGIVIIEHGTVSYLNARAAEIFGYPVEELRSIGWRTLAAPEERERLDRFITGKERTEESRDDLEFWIVRKDGTRRYVHTRYSQVESSGRIVARYLAVTDITERKQDEEALKQANIHLNLMNSVTRHDVLNQLAILESSLELGRGLAKEGEIQAHFGRMERAAAAIRKQIEFTRMYQDIGNRAPEWQNVQDTFLKAATFFDLGDIRLSADCGGYEISADPMLEKVFYNLIDNTLAHGGAAETITLTGSTDDRGMLFVYEDAGQGIPEEEKRKIFEPGFGEKTGYGLFIIRKILGITGIEIRETGVQGRGVRFEIRVPPGRHRIAPIRP